MGVFKKFKSMTGSVDKDLLKNGLLGRGTLMEVQQTRVSTGGDDAFSRPVCVFTVEVALDNVPVYTATCRQSVPITVLPRLVPGQTVTAVRVNPDNHDEMALDLATEPPEVVMVPGSGQATAADVLARGNPVRAVIVQTQPLGMEPTGRRHARVHPDGHARRPEAVPGQGAQPRPEDAVPLLFSGSNLPPKVQPEEAQGACVDWTAALAEFTK
jgi:hypothetical protein